MFQNPFLCLHIKKGQHIVVVFIGLVDMFFVNLVASGWEPMAYFITHTWSAKGSGQMLQGAKSMKLNMLWQVGQGCVSQDGRCYLVHM